ncbi:MAG: hypothetical protein HQ518_06035 [Rhodopirellula sp.]|nr:hypothetical protein [Rhodopirellula sp.]
MSQARRKVLFWSLFTVQLGGVVAILWTGLPVYSRLLGGQEGGATANDFLVASGAIVVMQLAYWIAFSLQRDLRFRKNVVVGHVLLWLSELSYFFPHALAALILFDRFKELKELSFAPARFALLALILFAVYCFKFQLETLGETLLKSDTDSHRSDRGDESL